MRYSVGEEAVISFYKKCDELEAVRKTAAHNPASALEPSLITRCAADIEPRRIEFLWPGRIARGKHTAIAGEPGDGKSQLSVFVAATVTCGGLWPCDEGRAPVGNVIILNAEDGAEDTMVPRLMAAGADCQRVHIVSAVFQGGRRAFNLQADLALLEKEIVRVGNVALVIIDPISSYMGKTDSHKNAEVRGALEPLSEMAERLKVAVLSITHFSKTGAGNNSKALHRFIGSIAFVGAPRAAFAVIQDTDNEGRILLLHAKNNMAAKPQGLAYRLVQRIVGKEGEGIVASYIAFDSTPVTVSADEALRSSEDGGDRAAAEEAEEFLRDRLADGAVVPAKDAEEHAHALGIARRTLMRARKKLGVIARREGYGREGQWFWSLPIECQKPSKSANKISGTLWRSWHSMDGAPPGEPAKPSASARPQGNGQPVKDPWEGLDIPDSLRRDRPRMGPPAISAGPDDDLGDLQ